MPRNLERRVEILFPVDRPELKEELLHILNSQLKDNVKASILQPDGSYEKQDKRGKQLFNSQDAFCLEAIQKQRRLRESLPSKAELLSRRHIMNKKIILASASPRRRELLTQIGLDFDVVVSETEEKINSTEPAKVVEELSAQKAEAVWEKLAESGVCDPEQKSGETTMTDTLVLGADTVVACDGKILGKPADTEAAAAMLTMLQGRGHEVYTGVTILYEENGERKMLTFHEKTTVHFIL